MKKLLMKFYNSYLVLLLKVFACVFVGIEMMVRPYWIPGIVIQMLGFAILLLGISVLLDIYLKYLDDEIKRLREEKLRLREEKVNQYYIDKRKAKEDKSKEPF